MVKYLSPEELLYGKLSNKLRTVIELGKAPARATEKLKGKKYVILCDRSERKIFATTPFTPFLNGTHYFTKPPSSIQTQDLSQDHFIGFSKFYSGPRKSKNLKGARAQWAHE